MKTFALAAILASATYAQIPFAAASEVTPDTVIVSFKDGTKVTIGDVRKMLENASPLFVQGMQTQPLQAIQQYYMFQHLVTEAEREHLAEKSPVKEQLEAQRAQVLVQGMINWEQDHFPVSEQMISAFYQQNISRYEQAKIKIIYLGFRPGAGSYDPKDLEKAARDAIAQTNPLNGRSEAEAKALGDELVKKLRAGADFKEFVQKYSDDPTSKADGGDFPLITATSSQPQDMKKAVLALKAGEISDPIKQPGGYYIIRVEDRSPQSLKDVTGAIIQEIRSNHKDQFMRDLTQDFQPKVEQREVFLQLDKYLGLGGPPKQ